MNTALRSISRAKSRGQALVLAVLVLPMLIAFTLLVVEVAERWLEVAMVEDALQQATRSAVQSLDYAALARNEEGLRASVDCVNVTTATAGACTSIVNVADTFLRANLSGVRGLNETTAALAGRVRWTVYPRGGTCTYSNAKVRTEATPLLCAEVRPLMRGVVGWGNYSPFISAGDTLDPTE
jgi:Flp pilus assembly protein TadG